MKVVLSGVKPSGIPTLGNYIGAIRNFARLQKEMKDHHFIFFVADLHAITVPHDVEELRKNIRAVAALYLACGLTTENASFFIQSEVPEHAEMCYVLQSVCYMGELERMTQYKDKARKQKSGIPVALFNYPTLMAADILLYDANYVPVGDDQKQHLELARNIAERFNNRYGETFVVPEALINKTGARIMNLQEPTKKMDKSESNNKGCIFLLESINSAKKKIKSAVTDSENKIQYHKTKKPGISNLMTIYSALTGLSNKEIEKKYASGSYGAFKTELAEIVGGEIAALQKRYNEIINSSDLDKILDDGRERAREIASKKLKEVYKKVGLTRR
ncbi:MAG: tryptophan--tRNA ligase [Bacilli bacterium]|nr:tryptophan--tRNA ligase [Bacillota bacterium]NLM32250.1 tryptophan--tRNA ligase [Acholeplasmataceae bacterium]HOA78232.1 tryptophan--tRNA ligase [Bacilli bacterium]HPZ26498.1 tryptophan--tRNA ligase [Bacilli bacterium]HQC88972.1 tryptophan--tRNA ligase [Bacilli bacterium]